MSILIALIVGVVIGGVATLLLKADSDLLVLNLAMGIVGSIIGLAIYFFFMLENATISLFSGPATACSILGAVIAVGSFDALHKLITSMAGDATAGFEDGMHDTK